MSTRRAPIGVENRQSSTKTKLFTAIERRITNVPHEEFLRKKDVTLEEKKTLTIYTIANLLAFIFQVAVVFFSNLHKLFNPGKEVLDHTLVTVIPEIFATEIILIVLLEFAFVIIPLPCMRCIGSRQHFQNILLLKVKWFFIVQCLFQSVAIFSFTLSEKKWFN